MKSAYELAMERLEKESPTTKLSDQQRQQLAEIDQLFKARIAEKEINLGNRLAAARQQGNFGEIAELEQQLQREVERLQQKAEDEKDRIRRE